jgi:hypothetical protein
MSSLHDVAKFTPNEIALFLVDPVTKELSRVCWCRLRAPHVPALCCRSHAVRSLQIAGLRELLGIREGASKEFLSATQKLEKLEFEQKQLALKGRQDKSALMEPQVAQASQYVRSCRERLDDITKGLIYVEARKFGCVLLLCVSGCALPALA